MKILKTIMGRCVVMLLLFIHSAVYGQTNEIGQFWNAFKFRKTLAKGWSSEFDLGQALSASSSSKSMFSDHSQWYLRQWIHFYPGARWKTSFFIAYYANSEIDSVQIKNNEWRWAIEGVYYFQKIGYTLSFRSRVENRGITNSKGDRTTDFRFREQLKFLYPIGGSKIIRKKIWYFIASDEVMFKTPSPPIFDRNRLTLGAGYSVTDDVQIEATYVNEYLPRPTQNYLHQVLQLDFIFNNFLSKEIRRWKTKPDKQPTFPVKED